MMHPASWMHLLKSCMNTWPAVKQRAASTRSAARAASIRSAATFRTLSRRTHVRHSAENEAVFEVRSAVSTEHRQLRLRVQHGCSRQVINALMPAGSIPLLWRFLGGNKGVDDAFPACRMHSGNSYLSARD